MRLHEIKDRRTDIRPPQIISPKLLKTSSQSNSCGSFEMDDSELFDVFSLDNNPEPELKTVSVPVTEDLKKPKPPKVPSKNGSTGKRSHDMADDAADETNGSHSPPASKKARKNIEDPIVVDSFETESDQVVPATQGLQGIAPVDENIVIKKRVSFMGNATFNV